MVLLSVGLSVAYWCRPACPAAPRAPRVERRQHRRRGADVSACSGTRRQQGVPDGEPALDAREHGATLRAGRAVYRRRSGICIQRPKRLTCTLRLAVGLAAASFECRGQAERQLVPPLPSNTIASSAVADV